jgi:hypothetical protein
MSTISVMEAPGLGGNARDPLASFGLGGNLGRVTVAETSMKN